jgi:hypothetical protein
MKDLKQIALTELENDKLYLLALTDIDTAIPDLKVATGAVIKEFVLDANVDRFDEDDEDAITDEQKLQLIEEDWESDIAVSAFILP